VSALRDAYELIRDESRWTRGATARLANGERTLPGDDRAVKWCAIGALMSCGVDALLFSRIDDLAVELFPGSVHIADVNDNLGHAAIVQVLEKALVEMEGGL